MPGRFVSSDVPVVPTLGKQKRFAQATAEVVRNQMNPWLRCNCDCLEVRSCWSLPRLMGFQWENDGIIMGTSWDNGYNIHIYIYVCIYIYIHIYIYIYSIYIYTVYIYGGFLSHGGTPHSWMELGISPWLRKPPYGTKLNGNPWRFLQRVPSSIANYFHDLSCI